MARFPRVWRIYRRFSHCFALPAMKMRWRAHSHWIGKGTATRKHLRIQGKLSSLCRRDVTAICNRFRRISTRRIRPTLSMCRSSFSQPAIWIFRQLPRQKVRRLRLARSNSIKDRRNLRPAISRSRLCGETSGRAWRSFPPTVKCLRHFSPITSI